MAIVVESTWGRVEDQWCRSALYQCSKDNSLESGGVTHGKVKLPLQCSS
jgi:hypothetical protein